MAKGQKRTLPSSSTTKESSSVPSGIHGGPPALPRTRAQIARALHIETAQPAHGSSSAQADPADDQSSALSSPPGSDEEAEEGIYSVSKIVMLHLIHP